MTEAEKKAYLSRYINACERIDYIRKRINEMRIDVENINGRTITDMPKGGEHKDIGDLIAEIVENENKLTVQEVDAIKLKYAIEEKINELDSQVERQVLIFKYIKGMTIRQMTYEIARSKTNIYKHMERAIKNINL